MRVRREWLDVFGRIGAANLTGPLPLATGEWIELRLRFAAVKAARTLLSFGANVEVIWPRWLWRSWIYTRTCVWIRVGCSIDYSPRLH